MISDPDPRDQIRSGTEHVFAFAVGNIHFHVAMSIVSAKSKYISVIRNSTV